MFMVIAVSAMLLSTSYAFASGQNDPVITLELKDASIKEALREIEKQTRYNFVINDNKIESVRKSITINIKDDDIKAILDLVLDGTKISYKIKRNNITLIPPSDEPDMVQMADSGGQYFETTEEAGKVAVAEYFQQPPAIVVTGKVTDETNAPLPGVNVLVKGTTIGTVTDSEGTFTLDIPSSESVLVFSFIGYLSQEVPVANQQSVNVQLLPDITTLSEVVVIGYGTQKKSDLTGSVGTVKAEEIQERQLPSVTQALAGRVAGVQVNVNSGRPGGQSNVRIRGFSSINTSSNPLYVVDGVIMPVGTLNDDRYALNNAIDNINPADIERIEVLKDASATAIYGARGANGVVLITTKRGSTTGGRITYDMQLSVPTIGPNRVEMLNAREFMEVDRIGFANMETYDTAKWNAGTHPDRLSTDAYIAAHNAQWKGTPYQLFDDAGNPLYDTDWLKESTQNKLSQNHQLAFTGGNKDNSYGLYLGYRDDNGLLLNSYLKRYSARFVMDSQIKPWLRIGGSLSHNNQEENIVDFGTGGLNSVRMITEALPILPVRYPNGQFSHNKNFHDKIEGGQNPVDQMTSNKYLVRSRTTLGSVYANFKLAEGLEFRSTIGANLLERERDRYNGRPALPTPTSTLGPNDRGTARLFSNRETFWSFENYLTYNKKFADIHDITVMLGQSMQETNIFNFNLSARNFVSDFFQTNNIGSAQDFAVDSPPVRSDRARFAFNSYFGRINYNLKDKYLLTLTGRTDGSSKFGTTNKYAFFPSAAIAWRVSEEPFLKGNSLISNLKLRTSYGYTGNSEITTYSSLKSLRVVTNVVSNNRALGAQIDPARLGNPDLQWEKTAQSDIGLELGLLDDRFTVEFDLYYRKTTDMLLNAPLPVTSGYTTITRNVGSLENKGLELTLNTRNVSTNDLTWTTTFNIGMNRNKVLKLASPAPIFGVGNPGFTNETGVIKEGEPVGSFWGLVRLGTWGTDETEEAAKYGQNTYRGTGKPLLPGDVKYLDVNGDYAINDADRMIIGNGNPKSYGSFINNVRYKAFDLTLDIQYVYGNDVLNMTKHSGEDRTGLANSYRSALTEAWTPENQNTEVAAIRDARAGYITNVDTRWVEDGSFIRGRNLILGYSLPDAVTERIRVDRLRVYASLQNFFLITEFSGNDPEVATFTQPFAQGQTFFDYPKPTTYMFGLSIGL
jgi:TonB-linked SusC/RagA family outer membrane protein